MALDFCGLLGFTISNTPGTQDVRPRALGMRGREVNFDAVEALKTKDGEGKWNGKRVNLEGVAQKVQENALPAQTGANTMIDKDFISFDLGSGRDHETLSYNHKLRRKLRRALDNVQVQKEMLVRQRAIDYLEANGVDSPSVLTTKSKPHHIKGVRILENGARETAKQERVRAKLDLAEFNQASRVLRKQAKQCAVEAGLRKHAELSGQLLPTNVPTDTKEIPLPSHIAAGVFEAAALAAAADRKNDAKDKILFQPSSETSNESYDESDKSTGTTSA